MTMGRTEASDFTRERLLAVLAGGGAGPVPADPDDPYVRPLRGGRATGPLAGGDLWLLLQTMGTPWEIELEGAILLFEEYDTPPWYVDGMLTQLGQAGKLAGVVGVVIGDMERCEWSEQRPEWPRPGVRAGPAPVRRGADPATRDGLFRQCFVDLDGLAGQLGGRWAALAAYALDRARTPAMAAALGGLMPELATPATTRPWRSRRRSWPPSGRCWPPPSRP